MTIQEKLLELDACEEARDWAAEKTLSEIWATCERGDWMLWLAQRSPGVDFRLLTAAKAACAEFSRPYMKDKRSIKALDMAHAFGRGECSADDLAAAASAAYAAASAAYAASASAAASAAYASAAASAAYAASAAAYAAYAAAYAEILQKCADEVRRIIPVEKLELI